MSMREIRFPVLVAIALLAPAPASAADASSVEVAPAAPEKRWLSTATIDFHVFSYRGNFGTGSAAAPFGVRGGGTQYYVPVSYGLVGSPNDLWKLELMIRSGYVSSRQITPNFTGQYVGFTDTALTATATYLGLDGIQPFLTVALNTPTGQPVLFGNRGRARLDGDFVDVSSFGEGLNFGPTLGANIPITANLVANASIGYTWRGNYHREGAFDAFGVQTTSSFTPGDSFNGSLSLTYSDGPFTGQLQGTYQRDGETIIDGLTTFRSGDRFSLTAMASYAFTESASVSATAMFSHSRNNFIADPITIGPGLSREALNSNSNLYRVSLEPNFVVAQGLAVGPTVSFLYRDRNAYNPVNAQFSPAKTRTSLGAFARYDINDSIQLNTRAAYVWTREDATPDKFDPVLGVTINGSAFPRLSYRGVQASIGLSAKF